MRKSTDVRNRNTLTIKETTKLLNKNDQYVRLGLQQNRFSFGSAVQKKTGHWSYHIVKSKVCEYLGMSIKEAEEVLINANSQ